MFNHVDVLLPCCRRGNSSRTSRSAWRNTWSNYPTSIGRKWRFSKVSSYSKNSSCSGVSYSDKIYSKYCKQGNTWSNYPTSIGKKWRFSKVSSHSKNSSCSGISYNDKYIIIIIELSEISHIFARLWLAETTFTWTYLRVSTLQTAICGVFGVSKF